MRNIFFYLLIICNISILRAQIKEFIILDSLNKKPIIDVNVYITGTKEGAITNEDGKVSVIKKDTTITISHISYNKKKKKFSEINDTIYLIPKVFELNEVVIHNIDLNKKLNYVLHNYENLYNTKTKNYECSYKEILNINGNISRLSQVQIDWWSKSYKYDFTKSHDSQNQVKLLSIDYSKKHDDRELMTNGGFVSNELIFEYLHLNYYPNYLIQFCDNISINSVNTTKDNVTKVIFNAEVLVNGEKIADHVNSLLFFEAKSGAILSLQLNIEYLNQQSKGVSRNKKIPYVSSVKKHVLDLKFNDFGKNKLDLTFFSSNVFGEVSYENKTDNLEIIQTMYITNIKEKKKIKKSERLNITNSFYESIPVKNTISPKILLTKKEIDFINE